MDDLIRRSDAIKAVEERSFAVRDSYTVKAILRNVPFADRPSGEWIIEKTCNDNYDYRCSYCDWYETHAYPDVEPYNFCPNCGAKMKGADDDNA